MRTTAALCCLLLACSSSGGSTPPVDSGAPADTGAVTDSGTPAGDTGSPSDAGSTGDAGSGSPFTMTAYRSTAPVRTFAMAEMVLDPAKDYRAVLTTDAGRIVLDLFEDRAPLAVNSFVFLALNHYFDGLAFHRVIEGFVAQSGDPLTATDNRARWGTGGPGYTFDTETVDGFGFDDPGVLGMARSTSRSSNGSQFFITLAAAPNLNGQYTVFGGVTEGIDVLPRIARNAAMTTPPVTPTRITRVAIEERRR